MGLKKPSGASFISAQGQSYIERPSNLVLEVNNLSFTPNIIIIRCLSDNGKTYQLAFNPFQMIAGVNTARGITTDKNKPSYLSNDSFGKITPAAKGFNAELNPPTDTWDGRTKCIWKAYYFPSLTEEAEKPF
ncbi:hypothetical protein [Bacillus cereus group sp. MG21]|uniref:hypothetical protein n=1 Tax=Bacillus cereus group sp. MG21 TaxID=3040251 RepID=UPI003391DDD6